MNNAYSIYFMSVLDVKRTKDDFLRKKGESNKELRELKTKVSRLEELLSEKGINLTDN